MLHEANAVHALTSWQQFSSSIKYTQRIFYTWGKWKMHGKTKKI